MPLRWKLDCKRSGYGSTHQALDIRHIHDRLFVSPVLNKYKQRSSRQTTSCSTHPSFAIAVRAKTRTAQRETLKIGPIIDATLDENKAKSNRQP